MMVKVIEMGTEMRWKRGTGHGLAAVAVAAAVVAVVVGLPSQS